MLMTNNLTKTSKFLSLVLRHKPQEIGLTLDDEGWAVIQDIIDKSNHSLTRNLIFEIVEKDSKQRFAISDDGLNIRANQGHSLKVNMRFEPVEPPQYLYHGTATRFVTTILREGLKRQNRQFVHLSIDTDTAAKVGQRHGNPAILQIPARSMHRDGYQFFQSQSGVWLSKDIPPQYLKIKE